MTMTQFVLLFSAPATLIEMVAFQIWMSEHYVTKSWHSCQCPSSDISVVDIILDVEVTMICDDKYLIYLTLAHCPE